MHIVIPFAEWLPDMPDLGNKGAIIATNVIPGPSSYNPFPTQVIYSTALGGRAQGYIAAKDLAGNNYNYVGDASRTYTLTGTSWSNVSRLAGGAYATPTDDFWEFVQWGETVVGVNGSIADDPQEISLGAANFVALAGVPPKARHIAVVRDFVVVGNLSGGPQTVQWCGINNSHTWTADAATLADSQILPGDGGWIQKIVGGEYGMIFQERAIFRMTFVGSPLIFQFDQVQRNIGAYAPQSVIGFQNFAFFLSEDGFYQFDGVNVKPIGRGKVDETFFADLDTAYFYRIQAAIDPINRIVMWAYPASGNIAGNPNKILIYNWSFDRWSLIEGLNIQLLAKSVTGGYTLESLDAIAGSSIDAMTVSFDSRQWNAGQQTTGCFDSSNRLNSFNGSAMPATLETGEFQLNKDMQGRSYITEVRPDVTGLSSSSQITLITRNLLTEAVAVGTALNTNATGFVPTRSTARYHRIRMTTQNLVQYDDIHGVGITYTIEGER